MSGRIEHEAGTYRWSEVADILGVGRTRLYAELRRQGLFRDSDSQYWDNTPEAELMRYCKFLWRVDDEGNVVKRFWNLTSVTPEGVLFILGRLRSRPCGRVPRPDLGRLEEIRALVEGSGQARRSHPSAMGSRSSWETANAA